MNSMRNVLHSMSQLLKRDGLWLPYLAFMVSFAAVALWLSDSMKSMSMATTPPGYNNHGLPHMFMRVLFKVCLGINKSIRAFQCL